MKVAWRVGAAGTVAGVALVAARLAMLPGIDFWDTAELQTVGPLLGTAHPPGFPTYVLLGWLASIVLQPFGEPAFRMNLLAGLCVAAAAGITVDLVRALTRSTLAGILVGLGFAFTPIVWAIGTRADAHALHLLFVAAILRLLVAWRSRAEVGSREATGSRAEAASRRDVRPPARPDRWLVAAAIVFGLSVGNHTLTLLLAPPIALFVYLVDRETWRNRRLVGTCAVACLATIVLVYLELPLRAGPFRASQVYGHPETWEGFWYVALGAQFLGSVANPFADIGAAVGGLVARVVEAFGILAPLVSVGFAVTWRIDRSYALLTGVGAAVTCLFAVSYLNADIGRYYLGPALMAWTWIGILAAEVARWAGRAVSGATPEPDSTASRDASRPTATLPITAAVVVALLVPTLLSLPDRYHAVDASQNRDAAGWVDHALDVMEPGAVLVSWWSYSTPLWYAQRVEGRRPDLSIIDDRTRLDENLGGLTDVIDAHLGRDPVYVIREDPREAALLAARYRLEPIDGPDALWLTRILGPRLPGS